MSALGLGLGLSCGGIGEGIEGGQKKASAGGGRTNLTPVRVGPTVGTLGRKESEGPRWTSN